MQYPSSTPLSPLAVMRLRSQLKTAIRDFFGSRRYLEIDTPIGVPLPGTEVHLGYFKTSWRDFKGTAHDLYLRSSPELHMKQAMALGADRIFQLATCFRNDGELAEWHHPEFTMLEWYEAGISFDAYVNQTEALLRETREQLQPLLKSLKRTAPELPKVLERIPVAEAFQRFAGVVLVDADPELARKGRAAGAISLRVEDDFETAFFKLLIEKIEPGLAQIGGGVLIDYPPSQAALATVKDGVAKRFEFYLAEPQTTAPRVVELCNGFEELLSEAANRDRIQGALRRRRELGAEVPEEDPGFYAALAKGLPPCCGNALGFDRWLGILTGERSLEQLIPFRRARPYGD